MLLPWFNEALNVDLKCVIFQVTAKSGILEVQGL